MLSLCIILLCFFNFVLGLQCSWMCDDPVCEPSCEPECTEPVCIFQVPCGYDVPAEVRCPEFENGDVDIMCPACETIVDDKNIPYGCDIDTVLCEALQCGWKCVDDKPQEYPDCERQCEKPVCELPPVDSPATRHSLF